jgi:hypothetical protein
MTASKLLRDYRQAVTEAIAKSHKAGRPVFQTYRGYLVAVHPDGRRERLKKIAVGLSENRYDETANGAARGS